MEQANTMSKRRYPFCEIERCRKCDDSIHFKLHLQKQCIVNIELNIEEQQTKIKKILNPYYKNAVVIYEKYGKLDGGRVSILESFSIMGSIMLYSNNHINWYIAFDQKCQENLKDFLNYHEAKKFDKCNICTLY